LLRRTSSKMMWWTVPASDYDSANRLDPKGRDQDGRRKFGYSGDRQNCGRFSRGTSPAGLAFTLRRGFCRTEYRHVVPIVARFIGSMQCTDRIQAVQSGRYRLGVQSASELLLESVDDNGAAKRADRSFHGRPITIASSVGAGCLLSIYRRPEQFCIARLAVATR
jgi:hypothetical protein